MKVTTEYKDLFVNNALTLLVHAALVVVLIPLNIFFPILLPIYLGIYVWVGYKFVLPTRHANYLSVLLVTLALFVLVATLLVMDTFATYQIAAWLSFWSLVIPLFAGLAFPTLFWLELEYLEALTLLGKCVALLGTFVPAVFFLLGMKLRDKRKSGEVKGEG